MHNVYKNVIVGAAFTIALAAPAFAQSYSATYGTGNIATLGSAESGGVARAAARPPVVSAYAFAPRERGRVTGALGPRDLSIR